MGCIEGIIEPGVPINASFIAAKNNQPNRNANAEYQMVSSVPPNTVGEYNAKSSQKNEQKIELLLVGRHVITSRGQMLEDAKDYEDFLTHHLSFEIMLCKYTSATSIRKRQILEHYSLSRICSKPYGPNSLSIVEYSQKAWMQRLIFDIFETADTEFFKLKKNISEVAGKISEKYLFELYQLREFLDAGIGKFSKLGKSMRFFLSEIIIKSDSALYPALKLLKEKYPQVADNEVIAFPEIKELKNDCNLLNNFESKCFSSFEYLNRQTILDDLKFLIDRSLAEFSDFQSDMLELLGEGVLTDSKVKRVEGSGGYTASPVRRVLIKWVETIIERIPDLIHSPTFLDFIRSKKELADNFFFKSTVQPTTHNLVINLLCDLLETAKYDAATNKPHASFGFFIYDLLRCKTQRGTGEEIAALLEKMKATTLTKSGKKLEVVRVKNRFKTPNRDLMVNFKYGNVIVAEAQLCIDASEADEVNKKINKFNHYIYELERGLFGPTFELVMQYEDHARTDIVANLEAEGKLLKRKLKNNKEIKESSRKCFNGHTMFTMVGNHFTKNEDGNYEGAIGLFCDYCAKISDTDKPYDYCYFCTLLFCLHCTEDYKKDDIKKKKLLINDRTLTTEITNEADLHNIIKKQGSVLLIFYDPDASASQIFIDSLIYLLCSLRLQKEKIPLIGLASVKSAEILNLAAKFKVQRLPTSMVLDVRLEAQRTVLGASITELESLFAAQQAVALGKSKILKIECMLGNEMHLTEKDEKSVCISCWNANSIFNFMNLFSDDWEYACSDGHRICLNCAYNAKEEPTEFRDYLGFSYLSSGFKKTVSKKCNKGHLFSCIKTNETAKVQFSCISCKKLFLFNNEDGMGVCAVCDVYACAQCIGIEKETHKTREEIKEMELVSHLCESTAEEAEFCVCSQPFKKAYLTRKHEIENEEEYDIFKDTVNKWMCLICRRETDEGKLHLACFMCKAFGQNKNIEICLECSIYSNLLNRQKERVVVEEVTGLLCPKNHLLMDTTKAYKPATFFDCKSCKEKYYCHTRRFHCVPCQEDYCQNCEKKLKFKDPPQCLQTCNEGHQMTFKVGTERLDMCDRCFKVLKKGHFKCYECDFGICVNCAATPMQQIVHHEQNQAYEYEQQEQSEQSEQNQAANFLEDIFN